MDGQALGAGQSVDVRGKLRRRLGGNLHGRDPATERAGAERAGEPTGAAGGQHVVGAGDVVAEGGRGVAADEHAAGGLDPLGEQRPRPPRAARGARGRRRWRGRSRRSVSGTWTSASGASPIPGRSAAARSVAAATASSTRFLDGDGDQRRVGAVLGLRAEVEGDPLGIGAVADDRHQLRGAGERVDADPPGDEPLRLPDPGVSGPDDDVDRARSSRSRGRGRRSPGRRRRRRPRRPRRARPRRGPSGRSRRRPRAGSRAPPARRRRPAPGPRTSARVEG